MVPKEQPLKLTSGLHIHVHTHACTTLVHVYIHMYVHTHTHTNCWMIQPVFIDSLAVSYIYIHSPWDLAV